MFVVCVVFMSDSIDGFVFIVKFDIRSVVWLLQIVLNVLMCAAAMGTVFKCRTVSTKFHFVL